MGFVLAVVNALVASLMNTNIRRLHFANTYLVNLFRFGGGVVVVGILTTALSRWDTPSWQFWAIILAWVVPADFLATFLQTRGFQRSEQSLVGPLYGLSIIFALPVGYLIFNEKPVLLGLAGVILAFLGVLAIGWNLRSPGVRKSLTRILKDPGSAYMIAAALCSPLVLAGIKLSTNYTEPMTGGFYHFGALFILTLPFLRSRFVGEVKGKARYAGATAITAGFEVLIAYVALSFYFLAYYSAVKRSSVIFDVLVGRLLGKEVGEVKKRLLGATLIFGGVILIALTRQQ